MRLDVRNLQRRRRLRLHLLRLGHAIQTRHDMCLKLRQWDAPRFGWLLPELRFELRHVHRTSLDRMCVVPNHCALLARQRLPRRLSLDALRKQRLVVRRV